MRVLVYPHAMELGGSQLNAIELAGALARGGDDVAVVGEPGPLADNVRSLGLDLIPIPLRRSRPSPEVIGILRREIRRRRIDVVHGFEWPPAIEAFLSRPPGRPPLAVGTIMSMDVPAFLPVDLPVTFGTRDLVERARDRGLRDVVLLEPPVDTDANAPGCSADAFRALVPEAPGTADIVVVSRLADQLKLSGLLEAVDAVAALPGAPAARLIIVGDGPARAVVQDAAEAANARCGRTAVLLTGALADPRGAYAAATVVLGMGGSALRALAFAKPLIVQGEHGFWRTLTPESAPLFRRQGWFGVGDGADGRPLLSAALAALLASPEERARLGAFGRGLVLSDYSLAVAAASMHAWYASLAQRPVSATRTLRESVRALPRLAELGAYKVRRRRARRRGAAALDDFNVVRRAPSA